MTTERSFFYAVSRRNIDVVTKAILEENFNINTQTEIKQSALHIAVSNCDIPMIEFLIQNGADCTLEDEYGCTPLRVSIAYWSIDDHNPSDYIDITKMLLKSIPNNYSKYVEISDAINLSMEKITSTDDIFDFYYTISYYSHWYIRVKVLQILSSYENIPTNIIARILEMQNDDNAHVKTAVTSIITQLGLKMTSSKQCNIVCAVSNYVMNLFNVPIE